MLPLVTFAGKSGVGKTTFAEKVVRELKAAGLRVGVSKHTHHDIRFDEPGKDSWRYAQAGSDVVVIGTRSGAITFDYSGAEVDLREIARQLEGRVDILIAEGYKTAAVPKIAVVRRAATSELPCPPDDLIAVVADVDLDVSCPQFALDQPREVAAFLVQRFQLPVKAAVLS